MFAIASPSCSIRRIDPLWDAVGVQGARARRFESLSASQDVENKEFHDFEAELESDVDLRHATCVGSPWKVKRTG